MGATFQGLRKESSFYLARPGWGLVPPRIPATPHPTSRPQQRRDEETKSETLEVQGFLNATEGARADPGMYCIGFFFNKFSLFLILPVTHKDGKGCQIFGRLKTYLIE